MEEQEWLKVRLTMDWVASDGDVRAYAGTECWARPCIGGSRGQWIVSPCNRDDLAFVADLAAFEETGGDADG